MDIIFPEYEEFHTKVLFYRIPKNASTSIYNHLGKANIINQKINETEKLKIKSNTYSFSKPDECERLIIRTGLKNYFSFCVVRNPWDRAVSMFFHYKKDNSFFLKYFNISLGLDFCSFLKEIKKNINNPLFETFKCQYLWTIGKNPPKQILRFENLSKEFEKMIKDRGIICVNPNLPHENKTEHNHYSFYYNKTSKKIVSDLYKEDITRFGYSFEEEIKTKKPKGFITI